MSLLKDMIEETAAAGATAAHAIATVPGGGNRQQGSLFGGGNIDPAKGTKKGKKRRNMLRRTYESAMQRHRNVARVINITEGWLVFEALGASSGETDFSASDVISKLDNAEKKAKAGDDTTAFGMEDEDGNLVKVYVKTESAEDFEKALASMLAGEDENDDDTNSALEIAEVLFKLKDKFEIVDVEWPEIEGDEEEEQELEGGDELGAEGEGGEGEGDLGLDDEGGEGGEGEGDLGLDDEGGDLEGAEDTDTADAKSALDKVIDMMKADADAKMAEAKAREAEAKAKEAEHTAKAAQARVEQEEQVLDMESYYKDKQDQGKEAKQLAKMAKFKHDKARDAEGALSMVESLKDDTPKKELGEDPFKYNDGEDEEDKELTVGELSTLILKNLRHN